MSIVTTLAKRLAFHEGRVATLKVVIEELNADAVDRFPGKFKQAVRLRGTVGDDGIVRAADDELSHIKKPKKKKHSRRPRFVFGRMVAGIVGSMAIRRKSLLDALHKQGLDGRGLGTLVKNGLLKLHADKYRLTQKGKAHYEVAVRTSHRIKPAKKAKKTLRVHAKAGKANGKGHGGAADYLAEVLAANGPMTSDDLLAKARAGGQKVTSQTIGAALRYKIIAASGPRSDKDRTFSVPA